MTISNLISDDLSELEARVVSYLQQTLRPGFCPSIEEISCAAGLGGRGYHITHVLDDLEGKGFLRRIAALSRSITLLRRTDGRPFSFETVWAPIAGLIGASRPRETAVQQDNPYAGEAIELTRGLLRGCDEVFTLVVSGDSMIEASINDGDIVVIAPADEVHDGDMVAADVAGEGRTLKYYHRRGRLVELRPANSRMPSLTYPPQQVSIEGKVVLVIRQLVSATAPRRGLLPAAA